MKRDAILESLVKEGLQGCTYLGSRVLWFDRLGSTIDYAKEHSDKLLEGTVIVAESQTRGRGRYGRKWHSPEGGLWVSYFLRNGSMWENPAELSIVAAVSAYRTLGRHVNCSIKYVNDIICNEKKIAGVLVEGDATYEVVGIGLNTNVHDFDVVLDGKGIPDRMMGRNLRDLATSVKLETGKDSDNVEALVSLSIEFDRAYSIARQGGMECLLEEYASNCSTIGKKVAVYKRNSKVYDATASRIDRMGRLVVDVNGKEVTLVDEEVFY